MNNNSLYVGEWIFNTLSQIEGITTISPVCVTQGTQCPYAVYYRQNIATPSTKDGASGDTLTYNLNIYTNKYKDGLQLITEARKKLSRPTKYNNMVISDFAINGGDEDFTQDIYIQRITFTIKVKDGNS